MHDIGALVTRRYLAQEAKEAKKPLQLALTNAARTAEKTAREAAATQTSKPELHTASISATEAATAEESKPKYTGWAVQIGSQRSEDAARKQWSMLKRKVTKRVGKPRLAIMKAELGKRGTFYRLRLVGFKDRKAARRACKALKRGRVSCLVVPANS
jgi:cell division septation protein DedD